jgi:hypothetical protein
MPSGDELDVIARLCRVGGAWVEGKKRPTGRRSRTWTVLLQAPGKRRGHPGNEAARLFVIKLQLAWLEATGKSLQGEPIVSGLAPLPDSPPNA